MTEMAPSSATANENPQTMRFPQRGKLGSQTPQNIYEVQTRV
jgi:hypothetical protein